jgi:hypothetical protein
MKKHVVRASAIVLLLVGALLWVSLAQAGGTSGATTVAGGGTTILQGGTGDPDFVPVTTKFAFNWREGSGWFECLALAPNASTGAGSGEFGTNAMYVTGPVTSATVRGGTAILKGTATVTGIGAGSDQPFTARVTQGGPGATLVLKVSGLTFKEILLEGRISF